MMRGTALFGLICLAALAAMASLFWQQQRPASVADHRALLERYCVTCHNEVELAGELALDGLSLDSVHTDAAVWEAAIRKLRGHLMPPPGEPRPPAARLDDLIAWLENSLDAAARAAPNPGAPALHRLNRAEYANAIRDLLDLKIDAATLLPGDDSSDGFDNIANALSVSPALLQGYVNAAAKISRLAVGDAAAGSAITTYRAPRGLTQAEHFDGQPLGTRGGLLLEHVFPLDAEYEIRVGRGGGGFGLEALGGDEDIEITVNGTRAAVLTRGGPRSATVAIPAGLQALGAAIIRKRDAQGVDDLFAVHAPTPGVTSVAIVGPLGATGVGETSSRRRIFVCQPTDAADEARCATEILRQLAERAYRRPVTPVDPALATLLEFYANGRALGSFDTGIQQALARVLVDPEFVFRFETEPAELPSGTRYAVSALELASRLSFFLWSSIPDDELREAALAGALDEPSGREQQIRRMLADSKAEALVANFASQWLALRQLDTVNPASNEFDGNLRHALRRETELLFSSIVRDDRSVVELLDTDYTFVDERLARHYGLPNIRGSRFRRIALEPTSPRRGLLGHGSILTVTSAPNRTSPVKRGQWVLQHILGTAPPPPPAGVETNLDETAPLGFAPTTMRERLERHMADPSCAACHNLMDPIGFALENFDFIGQWRDADSGSKVDSHGVFVDGGAIEGPAGLRRVLLARREQFVATLAEKLLTYALGRTLGPGDMPAVREIVRRARASDYRWSALVLGVVESVPMQMRTKT